VLLITAMLYMICAILRLARFNVQATLDPKSHRSFRGLPSPAAAGCVASLAILRYDPTVRWGWWSTPENVINPLVHWIAPLAALTVALLMVSRVPYPHLVNQLLHRRKHFSRVVQMVLMVFAIALVPEIALVVMFWGYALYGPARLLWYRAVRHQAAPTGEREGEAPAEPVSSATKGSAGISSPPPTSPR
jgi:CDP-diacylglycerol---serine O-phosphatidyltransferase